MFFWSVTLLLIAPFAALFGVTGASGIGSNLDAIAFIFGFGMMWLMIVLAVATLSYRQPG